MCTLTYGSLSHSYRSLFLDDHRLITQLTIDIKAHLDFRRSSLVVAAPTTPLPDNSVMRFKWPETELPLYLIISNADEDPNRYELGFR